MAYDMGHGRRLGGRRWTLSWGSDQWPASTAVALLARVRGDFAGQIERIDALVAGLEADDEPQDAA